MTEDKDDRPHRSHSTWAEVKEKYEKIKAEKLSVVKLPGYDDLTEHVKSRMAEFERFTSSERSAPMLLHMWRLNEYPTTIVPARYGGAYEGAPWLAFPYRIADSTHTHWDGNDVECKQFWVEVDDQDFPIGRGASPSEALADLSQHVADFSDPGSYERRSDAKTLELATLTWFSADIIIPQYVAYVCQFILDKGHTIPLQWADLKDPVDGADILNLSITTLKDLAEAAISSLEGNNPSALSDFYEALAESVELGCLWD